MVAPVVSDWYLIKYFLDIVSLEKIKEKNTLDILRHFEPMYVNWFNLLILYKWISR